MKNWKHLIDKKTHFLPSFIRTTHTLHAYIEFISLDLLGWVAFESEKFGDNLSSFSFGNLFKFAHTNIEFEIEVHLIKWIGISEEQKVIRYQINVLFHLLSFSYNMFSLLASQFCFYLMNDKKSFIQSQNLKKNVILTSKHYNFLAYLHRPR